MRRSSISHVEWLMDTAFSHSAMTESEARMLGVAMQGPTTAATDFAGGTAAMRTAVAERMTIGDAELRNVVAALQSIRWTRQGWCQVGPNTTRGGPREQAHQTRSADRLRNGP